jgi:lipoprotein Spr
MKKLFAASALALSMLLSTAVIATPAPASAAVIYATHGDQIVNTADSYIGKVKYKFGTRDPAHLTFDCSSFTQYVFQKNGIKIPWGSSAQTSFGTKVTSKSNLNIGDLVMLSVNTPGKINHVGIYIGNGQFISNMPSKGVAVSSLTSGYWSTRFIQGRHY